jgi:hypothetical protein
MKPKPQPSKQEIRRNGIVSSSTYQMAQIIFALQTRVESGRYVTSWVCNDCGERGASGDNCATVDESVANAKVGLLEHQRVAHTGRKKKPNRLPKFFR